MERTSSGKSDKTTALNLHIKDVLEEDRGCYMCQINTNPMKNRVGCLDVHGKLI